MKNSGRYYSDSESEEENYILEGENETKYFHSSNSSYYWNGHHWTEAENVQINRKFQKTEITIVSWNIWFGERNREARMEALCEVVSKLDPDIIAFQEVTPSLLKIILSEHHNRLFGQYFLTDWDGRTLGVYGNVIFSKVKFHEISVTPLNSRMGRKAILTNLLVKGCPPIVFGTFHLESNLEDIQYRALQLRKFRELTENCETVILMGDTNFTSENEINELGSKFRDMWKDLYQQNPGLTFDTTANSMAREERSDLKQQRLDRCFYSFNTIEGIEMKILGSEPYFENEWISDHFGIMVKLRLKN